MSETRSFGATRENPFVGLRPFFDTDSLYFFGRDEQVTALLDLLHTSRFVPVLGSSGSGKSSLVRAGLIPTLHAGFMVTERDGWRIAPCLPGDTPVENFAEALLRAAGETATGARIVAFAQQIRDDLDDAIVALFTPRLTAHENVLILVDQFEEIFAFRSAAGTDADADRTAPPDVAQSAERLRRRQDASLLVSVLLRLAERTAFPVYIVTTMRTDFLGDCDLFTGLPEAVNRSGYLVPRLTRAQLRHAVEGPPRLMGARVAPRLIDRVLNDVGDHADRLPLMQHALQRTYHVWKTAGMIGPLDVEDLDEAGGLDRALDVHAEQVITGIDLLLVERVFKRLTSVDSQQRRVRRPARLSELRAVAEGDDAALRTLLDRCVREGTNFMYASKDGQNSDPRYNISHESLVRQWNRLREWVDDEQVQREWYEQLAERAAQYARDPDAGLLSRLDLRIAEATIAQRKPTAAWAERYPNAAAGFARTMGFVQESAARVQRARRTRIVSVAAVLLLLAATAISVVRSGRIASAAIARVDEVARDAAIGQLADIDPTFAAALAAELAAEATDPSRWSPERRSLLQRVLNGTFALAEYHDVVAFAADSRGEQLAVSFSDGRTEVGPIDGDGEARVVLPATPGDTVVNVFYVKGGGVVVGYRSGEIRHLIVDTTRAVATKRVWTLPDIARLNVTADSLRLLALDDAGQLWSWSLEDAKPTAPALPTITNYFVHPTDGARTIVVTDSNDLRVLNAESGVVKRISRVGQRVRERSVRFVAFSPFSDEMLMGEGVGRGALLYVRGDTAISGFGGDSSVYTDAAFNPVYPNVLLTTSQGYAEIYYPSGSGRTDSLARRFRLHQQETSARYSHDGAWIISGAADGDLRWTSVWDSLATVRLPGHAAYLWAQATTARDMRIVSADADGMLRVWRPPSVTQAVPFSSEPLGPIAATLASRGAFAILDYTNSWHTVAGIGVPGDSAQSSALTDSFPALGATALSPSGRTLFVEYGQPRRRELRDHAGSAPIRLPSAASVVAHVAFSDNERMLVLVEEDGRTRFLDATTGKPLHADWTRTAGVQALAVSPAGDRVTITSGDTLMVLRLTNSTVANWVLIPPEIASVSSMQFSPDGSQLLLVDMQGTAAIVDVVSGAIRVLGDWSRYTTAEAISRSGALIALATDDRAIRLFSARDSLAPPFEIPKVSGTVVHLAFGPHDSTLVATKASGEISIWPITDERTVGIPVTLHHTPPVPNLSDDAPIARTVMSDDGKRLTSVFTPSRGLPRIGRWELDPAMLRQQLLRTTFVCLDSVTRQRLLPGETAVQLRTRTAACERRAGRLR